jgi:DUF1680 family protein
MPGMAMTPLTIPDWKPSWKGPMGLERVARIVPVGYRSQDFPSNDATAWVQVDLGGTVSIDRVKLLPSTGWEIDNAAGFPVRFKIETSNDPAFQSSAIIADQTAVDYPNPGDFVSSFPGNNALGRYVRLTALALRDKRVELSKLEVWSGGVDVAQGCSISDNVHGNLGKTPLTRHPRGQGEGVQTDHPNNVIPADQWRPVPFKINAPLSGVRLGDGVFKDAMDNNIHYLLTSFTADELLRPFRDRAGKPQPDGMRPPVGFWDTDLPGSNAGRFLMGAGNTLRWVDHPELKAKLDTVVDGIEECRADNGYIMGYPDETIFYSERGAYTRSWVTHGLIEAGFSGNPKAFPLLRGYYDWFDQCKYLPELIRRAGQGVQGQIANTRVYHTPIGKPADIQVIQRYFQEDYWMDQLARRDPDAIWRYPYDHPHNYLITSLEPYLDQYTATGAKKYLDAAMGGWDLYHDNWLHIGGTIAICEGDVYEPKSYYLHRHTGELCGSVFWARYSQRFQFLYPDQEKYPAQIEKAIYNVAMANQVGGTQIRYHAHLVGKKDKGASSNTCCEGQGTRLIGSIPEYVYSLAPDGLYVNLYHNSSVTWQVGARKMTAQMETKFPYGKDVTITLATVEPVKASLRIRVPGWAKERMAISVNGKVKAAGDPGSYVPVDRTWKDGDKITFTLPADFTLTEYKGFDQIPGRTRYALEWGPILLAAVGVTDPSREAQIPLDVDGFAKRLTPIDGSPLHFAIDGDPDHVYRPYWQVGDETFTCFPAIGTGATTGASKAPEGDLALASKGATAQSDSELAREPGCTPNVISGAISPSGDFSSRWHSSIETPNPHWIQVTLAHPQAVARIIILFADPEGHPVSFQGVAKVNGADKVVFDVDNYTDPFKYEVKIPTVVTSAFRLIIRSSANPAYPNAAQVNTIELFGP